MYMLLLLICLFPAFTLLLICIMGFIMLLGAITTFTFKMPKKDD